MKNLAPALLLALCLASPAFAQDIAPVAPANQELSARLAGDDHLPNDVRAFIDRRMVCNHWQGEEPFTTDHKREISAAVRDLGCRRLEKDEKALRRKYRGAGPVRKALTDAKDAIPGDAAKGRGMAQDDAQIVAWFRKVAEKGDANAQFSLGHMYEIGIHVPRDHVQAAMWYRKAADQELVLAQNSLGVMYMDGDTKDDAQAVAWFRKAADQGNVDAQNNLAKCYEEGTGVARDDAQAVAWYRKAAEQGSAKAQDRLGMMYLKGRGVARDDAQAVAWFRKAADQGYTGGQISLAFMYTYGRGVARNKTLAAAWQRKASENERQEMLLLANLLGAFEPRPRAQAVSCRKAADQGDAEGQECLGDIYTLRRNNARAAAWYAKAAKQGAAGAQWKLGDMYKDGRGVARDDAQAVAWFRKAADQGDLGGQSGLGEMYRDGRGVKRNDAQAVEWFVKAANQDHCHAAAQLRRMEASGRSNSNWKEQLRRDNPCK